MAEQYRALLIGNASYPEDRHNLKELVGLVNDIFLLRGALEDERFGMFPKGSVELWPESTAKQVLGALEKFFGSARRDEVLLLYYSGHGLLDHLGTLYLCARDTKADKLISTAISSQQIDDFIGQSSASRMVIILDCCHSGAFKSGDFAGAFAGTGRYVLSSCRAVELAEDASIAKHPSLFTEYLVAGLRGAATSHPNADHLTIEELHKYVRSRLKEHRQRPQFITRGELGLAIARRPVPTAPATTDASSPPLPSLVLSESRIDLYDVELGEVLPVERVYVTARRPDRTPARWTVTATADWVRVEQRADPDRVELTVTPRSGNTRANIEVRNEETGEARTIRLVLRIVEERTRTTRADPVDTRQPARPVTSTTLGERTDHMGPSGHVQDVTDPSTMVDIGRLAEERGKSDEADRWYRRAADAGDVDGMYALALLLYEQHNVADATRWFRQAAASGSADAMVTLGVLAGDDDNVAESEAWFLRAAQAGAPEGMVSLGLLVVDRDVQEAQRWFLRAAGLGNSAGMLQVGLLALEKENDREAEHWFRMAAEADDVDAMVHLGELLLDRDDDTHQAEQWFLRAADAGDPEGMFNLGCLALARNDEQEAERWLRRAAGDGHSDGMAAVGWLALNRGDIDEATEWFRRAVAADNTEGMVGLGNVALVRSDHAAAGQWFQKAANGGNTDGMVQLGSLALSQGREDNAERWFRTAADAGDTDAMAELGTLLQRQGREDEAAQLFQGAHEAGHTTAMDRFTAQLREDMQRAVLLDAQTDPGYPDDVNAYEAGQFSDYYHQQ